MSVTRIIVLAALVPLGVAGCDQVNARDAGRDADGSAPAPSTALADASPQRQGLAASIDLGFTLGEENTPIAVVEFSDFGCPYCARFARGTLPSLRSEYIEQGTIRWRFVPVVFGFPGGELMGSAAVCAAQLGDDEMFWRAHDLLYTRQQALRGDGARPQLLDWLAELGLDRDALATCIDAPGTAALLRQHTQTAREWYVRGTPTFLVNGVPMSGAAPTDFFRRVFDTVLDPSGL